MCGMSGPFGPFPPLHEYNACSPFKCFSSTPAKNFLYHFFSLVLFHSFKTSKMRFYPYPGCIREKVGLGFAAKRALWGLRPVVVGTTYDTKKSTPFRSLKAD